MDEQSVLNVFKGVSTPNLPEEQKREIAKLLAVYLDSQDFALHVQKIIPHH